MLQELHNGIGETIQLLELQNPNISMKTRRTVALGIIAVGFTMHGFALYRLRSGAGVESEIDTGTA